MDIAITWDNVLGRGDWSTTNGDLALGSSLESAIAISLFTDAEAPASGLNNAGPQGVNRRGWWGDAFADQPIGSTLWQLSGTPKSGGTNLLLQAQAACQAALQWLIDDGIAQSVTVTTQWAAKQAIAIAISIVEPTGTQSTFQYSWAWSEL